MVSAVPTPQLIKILSIDGGGIRGIIPAMVLAKIERQTGRPACELFDLIAGTSTGGIITLGVTAPGEEQPDGKRRPRWSAEQLVDIYANDGTGDIQAFAAAHDRDTRRTGEGEVQDRRP
jgi:patatin-like phospholipase/acyl hydrolase